MRDFLPNFGELAPAAQQPAAQQQAAAVGAGSGAALNAWGARQALRPQSALPPPPGPPPVARHLSGGGGYDAAALTGWGAAAVAAGADDGDGDDFTDTKSRAARKSERKRERRRNAGLVDVVPAAASSDGAAQGPSTRAALERRLAALLAPRKAALLAHQLAPMGFPPALCAAAVRRHGADLDAAASWLLEAPRDAASASEGPAAELPVAEEMAGVDALVTLCGCSRERALEAACDALGDLEWAVLLLLEPPALRAAAAEQHAAPPLPAGASWGSASTAPAAPMRAPPPMQHAPPPMQSHAQQQQLGGSRSGWLAPEQPRTPPQEAQPPVVPMQAPAPAPARGDAFVAATAAAAAAADSRPLRAAVPPPLPSRDESRFARAFAGTPLNGPFASQAGSSSGSGYEAAPADAAPPHAPPMPDRNLFPPPGFGTQAQGGFSGSGGGLFGLFGGGLAGGSGAFSGSVGASGGHAGGGSAIASGSGAFSGSLRSSMYDGIRLTGSGDSSALGGGGLHDRRPASSLLGTGTAPSLGAFGGLGLSAFSSDPLASAFRSAPLQSQLGDSSSGINSGSGVGPSRPARPPGFGGIAPASVADGGLWGAPPSASSAVSTRPRQSRLAGYGVAAAEGVADDLGGPQAALLAAAAVADGVHHDARVRGAPGLADDAELSSLLANLLS